MAPAAPISTGIGTIRTALCGPDFCTEVRRIADNVFQNLSFVTVGLTAAKLIAQRERTKGFCDCASHSSLILLMSESSISHLILISSSLSCCAWDRDNSRRHRPATRDRA